MRDMLSSNTLTNNILKIKASQPSKKKAQSTTAYQLGVPQKESQEDDDGLQDLTHDFMNSQNFSKA